MLTAAEHRIAELAAAALRERVTAALRGTDGQWRNLDVRQAFIDVLRHITVDVVGPGRIRTAAPAHHRGALWAYAGGEALDAARRDAGIIGTVERIDPHTFTLTFTP